MNKHFWAAKIQNASKQAQPRHIIIRLGVSLFAALVKCLKWLIWLVGLWFHHGYAGKSQQNLINEGLVQGKTDLVMVVLNIFHHILPI